MIEYYEMIMIELWEVVAAFIHHTMLHHNSLYDAEGRHHGLSLSFVSFLRSEQTAYKLRNNSQDEIE